MPTAALAGIANKAPISKAAAVKHTRTNVIYLLLQERGWP
jgi:hypothetical protein